MQRLNYNQLYYFYVVANEGSIKSACEKLHLTQPTISCQLKMLEENFGYQLFDRKYRKLEINKKGKEVLKKAEKIFLMGDELMNKLPEEHTNYQQELRIGIVNSLPTSFVNDFTVDIWSKNNVSCHILHGKLADLIQDLDGDSLDLVLSDIYFNDSKYNNINLGEQKYVVVGGNSFKNSSINFPQCLNNAPYLSLSKDNQIQKDIDFYFEVNNINPNIIGTVDSLELILNAVKKDNCFAIIPEVVLENDTKDGNLTVLGDANEIISSYWAITSNVGCKRLSVRLLINNYKMKKRNLNIDIKSA
ncbi:MAG: LysR family transcriptional regulator [Bdellovibrionales bacterium]|nr:LysR family transcriptional regulator [Bdellovibrionales bacterium]